MDIAKKTNFLNQLPLYLLALLISFHANAENCSDDHRSQNKSKMTQIYKNFDCAMQNNQIDKAYSQLFEALDYQQMDLIPYLESDKSIPLRSSPQWNNLLTLAEQKRGTYLKLVNRELYDLFLADKLERAAPDKDKLNLYYNHQERTEKVRSFINNGQLHHADDYYHAAAILQHGHLAANYKQAHELALTAVSLNSEHSKARMLACKSEDSYLLSMEQPQIWGTHYKKQDGKWTLEPFDKSKKSDQQRLENSIPTIESQNKILKKLNSDA